MTWKQARKRGVRTVPLAVVLATWAERPRSLAALDELLDARGVPEADRVALRRAWRDGGVVFFIAATNQYGTRQKLLTVSQVTSEYLAAIGGTRTDLSGVARSLVAGEIDLTEFQRRAGALIEEAIIDAALALVGPLWTIMPAVMNAVLAAISAQLHWLALLVADIIAGKQRIDGSLLRRLGMYGGAGWAALQEIARQLALTDGLTEERNVLAPAEHCQGCLNETDRGWVKIGELVPIGSRDCLSNDLCHFEFR